MQTTIFKFLNYAVKNFFNPQNNTNNRFPTVNRNEHEMPGIFAQYNNLQTIFNLDI